MGRPVTAVMAAQTIEMLNDARPEVRRQCVNPPLIRKWAERGKVKTYGLNANNQQLYDLHDIIKAAAS